MRRFPAVVIFIALAGSLSAQKVMVPAQSSNPNLIITPTQQNQAEVEKLDAARRIPRDEAIKLVKEKKAIFVDVRPKESYEAGHIKGAISIPESELIKRLKEIPPKRMIITYCA
jgi:3-mercaptopyruvate sulfurtransferase SseA